MIFDRFPSILSNENTSSRNDSSARRVEDLQQRYYDIVSRVKAQRAAAIADPEFKNSDKYFVHQNQAFSSFDVNVERERRYHQDAVLRKYVINDLFYAIVIPC